MYTFPSPYWDEVSDEAVDLVQGLLAQDTDARLTVDQALDHVWMTMEVKNNARQKMVAICMRIVNAALEHLLDIGSLHFF